MEWSSAGQVGGGASEGNGTGCERLRYRGSIISEIHLHKTKQGELERVGPLGQRSGRNEVGMNHQLFRSRIKSPAPHTKCHPGGLSLKSSQNLPDPLALRRS